MGYTHFDKVSGKTGIGVGIKGAEIEVATSTGQLKQQGTAIAISATLMNQAVRVAKVALAAADTAGGILSWVNPESSAIIIQRILLDITTKATGACTADFGTTAVNATTLSDNLIDGVDIYTAAGVFDNITDKGTDGKSKQKLAAGKWVTGSKASGAAAGTVGFAYIEYIVV